MSSRVGWVLPSDRVAPRELITLAERADAAGFRGVLAADTFQPWLPSLGEAPSVWPLLAAIGEHISGDVVAGMAVAGYRMHPAALAQAAATLATLHPGRALVSMAPGEAINEHVTGAAWPEAPARIDRMFESLVAMGKLLGSSAAGKDARFTGRHVNMEAARLWTMPDDPADRPPLLVATGGPVTAHRAGRSAGGIMTIGADLARAKHLLARFADGARQADRDVTGLRRIAHMAVCWAPTEAEAMRQALARFPIGAMRFARGDLRSPVIVEQIAQLVRAEDLADRLLITADPARVAALIADYLACGYEQVYVHHVGDGHAEFLDMCGEEVLPALKSAADV